MKINLNNKQIKSLFLLSLVGLNLAKEESSKNQTEITLNSLPQIGVANFTKRGNETDTILVFAGYPLFLGNGGDACSFGFAIIWPDGSDSSKCTWTGLSGFIVSIACCPSVDCGCIYENCSLKDVFLNSEDKTKVGYVRRTISNYIDEGKAASDDFVDVDFAFVAHDKPSNTEDNIKFIPYVVGEKNELIPITSYGPASLGERVCVYTNANGRMCGKVVSLGENEQYRGAVGKIIMEVGSDGTDHGGPVYKEIIIGDRTIAQLVGHISMYDINNEPTYVIYYTLIEKLLEFLATKENCNMVPLVYNETNAQEYDNLLAQIEIPAKK